MRTIDLSSSARTFEYTPRTPPSRPSFLPFSLTQSPPTPRTKSPYFSMPRKAAQPKASQKAAPRATRPPPPPAASLIPDFFRGPATTPRTRANVASVADVTDVDEFDGIEAISEADYTPAELRRSAQRKAARALKRLSSSTSSAIYDQLTADPPSSSRAVPSSAPSLDDEPEPEIELEPEHIDLVSSPVRRSPRKHPALASSITSSTNPTSSRPSPHPPPSSKPSSGVVRSPTPLVRRNRRRVVSSGDEDDVPLSRTRARPAAKPRSTSPAKSSSPIKATSLRKGKGRADPDESEDEPALSKGKGRADPDENDEIDVDDYTFLGDVRDPDSPDNYDDGWDDNMAMAEFEPIDIPDFEMLPSTQPPRERTPTPPIYISDDGPDPVPVVRTRQTPLRGAAARAAALGAAYSPYSASVAAEEWDEVTLVSALPAEVREFYENHWRRGADSSDENDDPDDFGVAAVVPKRAPARGGKRGRGGWRGGRGARRGVYRRKK